jgi:hypothetical protein
MPWFKVLPDRILCDALCRLFRLPPRAGCGGWSDTLISPGERRMEWHSESLFSQCGTRRQKRPPTLIEPSAIRGRCASSGSTPSFVAPWHLCVAIVLHLNVSIVLPRREK